ncbi:unnamed protein product [Caenorhabditis auriculariae]|uniref:Uncharacterized protein n=1 Tax=Caenorhabditis auriculariae TaxID=2777116 RepID=A0A8S1GMD0_9PELO|nr:unnamed protein product [Caenorhabditis auriculariae]
MTDSLSQDLNEYLWGKTNQVDYLKRAAECNVSSADGLNKKIVGLNEMLDKQLRKGIEVNLSRLLEQVPILQSLEDKLHVLRSSMHVVSSECSKLAETCGEHVAQARENTKQLERAIHRKNIVADAQRCDELLDLLGKRNELVKKSEFIFELKEIIEENKDLIRIAWLKNAVETKLKITENEVRRNASEDLRRALSSLNTSLVTSAQQALKNLGVLESELDVLLSSIVVEIDKKLIDLSASAESGQNALPICVNCIHTHLEQTALLNESYQRKFSERVARLIRSRVPLDSPIHLSQVGRIFQSKNENSFHALIDSLRPLKNSLLAHSLARLHQIIDDNDFELSHANAFVDLLNAAIDEELTKADWDVELASKMRGNVEKCLEMVAKKLECNLHLQPNDLLIGDRLSGGQLVNYRLILIADGLMKRWPESSKSLKSFQSEVLEAVLGEIKKSVAAILVRMHSETFGTKTSPYMQELVDYISRVDMHLAHFSKAGRHVEIISNVTDYVIDCFLLNASLVRTFATPHRLSIQADLSRLLEAINELEWSSRYGDRNSLLDLFSAEPYDYLQNRAGVRKSILIHLLIADSPANLLSPPQSVGWTVQEYITWFEEHGEVEILDLLSGLLNSYASSVTSLRETTYVPSYPIILDLLKQL